MPKLGRKTPCNDCPYRRDSARGWLGAETDPEVFVSAALSDFMANPADIGYPCHLAIDYSDPDWKTTQLPDADLCAGALIMAANNYKLPRQPERAEAVRAVKQSPAVFRYADEFIAHHTIEGKS